MELNEDEAASVALHIVNAEYDTGVRNTMNITCLIRDVVNIVSEYLNIELQEESLHYARFITHLKFLGQRILRADARDDDNGFGKVIAGMYPVEYACSEKIAHYIKCAMITKLQMRRRLIWPYISAESSRKKSWRRILIK